MTRLTIMKGRCIRILTDQSSVLIQNEKGITECVVQSTRGLKAGDIVDYNSQTAELKVLTPNQTELRTLRWMEHVMDPRRLHGVRVREIVESGIRDFFSSRGFRETRTPTLVYCPGMEPHIRPFKVEQRGYLQTSPEFAMKKLLAGGLEKIFQICPVFRNEPNSSTHSPEFTMLEWYRAYASDQDLMKDVEALIEFLVVRIFGKPEFEFQGKVISVKTPWPRLRVRDLFQELVQVDLVKTDSLESLQKECRRLSLSFQESDTWDDLYFRIWLNLIEPKLPVNRAVFVTRYPASQAALAKIDSDPDGSKWARRFEVYAGGLELGNAFEELTDPVEQKSRFIKDMALREGIYGAEFPSNPIDNEFIDALTEGMPPSAGIAIGVDRLTMLCANEPEIRYTQWLQSVALSDK